MNIKRSLLITVLFTIAFAFITGTLSYLIWQTGESKRIAVNFSVPGICSVSVDGGGDVDASMVDMYPASCTDMAATIVKEINLEVEFQMDAADILVELWLNVNSIDSALSNSENFRYILSKSKKSCYEDIVSSGTFNGLVSSDKIKILEETYVGVYPHIATDTYYLYIWLDEAETSIETVGKSFSLSLGGDCGGVVVSTSSITRPVIDEGMIPVTIANDGTVTTISETNPNWYNYDDKEWANVVLVKESGTQTRSYYQSNTGVTVEQSDILAYYTWIPRYSYKIPSKCSEVDEPTMETHPSCYDGDTVNTFNGDTTFTGARPIDILFETGNSSMLTGDAVSTYRTHPAFWWDNDSDGVVDSGEMVPGIWVGKFETSTEASSTCYTTPSVSNCNNAEQSPRILPNVSSLRYQSFGNRFQTSLKFAGGTLSDSTVTFAGNSTYGLTANVDSHMMKNSELGAVAYLSHSIYGINSDIRKNNNSSFLTGCGASEDNGASTTSCEIAYGGATSYPQSTTGNITGIFDLSGGAADATMANYNNVVGSSEITTFPESKYYDKYTTTDVLTACDGGICYGHALSETLGWYSGEQYFVTSSAPWLNRGDYHNADNNASLWRLASAVGGTNSTVAAYSTIIPLGSSSSTDNVATITSTNNMADSQTVTLDWSGKEEIVSYYWGNVHPYSGVNWDDATSVSTVTKTVSEPGTYYLGIKYSSGDITVLERVFYKTTFSISNGSVSPTSVITMSGNSFTIPDGTASAGYKFNGWYTAANGGGTNKSGSYTPTSSTTLYAYMTAYKLYVKYYTDGGEITASSGGYTWSQGVDGIVKRNGSDYVPSVSYGSTINFANYNNSSYVNISKWSYIAVSGAEWICFEGCSTANKTINQDTDYEISELCDISNSDCTIKLKVNWSFGGTAINTNRYKWGLYDDVRKLVIYYITVCYDGTCKFTSKYGLSGTFTGVDYDGSTSGTGFVSESVLSSDYTSGTYATTPWSYYINNGSCYSSASTSTSVVKTYGSCTFVSNLYLTGYSENSSDESGTRWFWNPTNNCYYYREQLYTTSSC